MQVLQMETRSLGDSSYLLEHDGVGILVDPQRDVDRFLDSAAEAGTEIAAVLETHVHNDYASGGRIAAERVGARLVLPAAAGVAFAHQPAFHREELDFGSLRVRPLHTPGHTPEHVAYLVLVDDHEVAVFTGGSLLVGAAGRTDLLGGPWAHSMALLQHGSLQRLSTLPDDVVVYPTHGRGSFCAASTSAGSTSTIGEERRTNPNLRHRTATDYADAVLPTLGAYPRYYERIGPLNRLGVDPLPSLSRPELIAQELAELADEVTVVDCRPRDSFLRGHVPGSISIEASGVTATWAGWLLPFDTPTALVGEEGQDLTRVVLELARIGFDDVRGIMHGLNDWQAQGFQLATIEAATLDECVAAAGESSNGDVLVDVRMPDESETLPLGSAVRSPLPEVTEALPPMSDDKTLAVVCATGYRAVIGASLLQARGYRVRAAWDFGAAEINARMKETVDEP